MAKNAPSKTSPVAAKPAASTAGALTEQTPPPASTMAEADMTKLRETLTEAERALDGEDREHRPSPEQLAKEMLASPADVELVRKALAIADANAAAKAELGDPGEIVRVYHLNKSKGSFIHGEHRLDPNGHADVPASVAELWLTHKDASGAPLCAMSEAAPVQPSAESNRLKAELEAKNTVVDGLNQENDSLTDRIQALEAELKAAKLAGTPPPNP